MQDKNREAEQREKLIQAKEIQLQNTERKHQESERKLAEYAQRIEFYHQLAENMRIKNRLINLIKKLFPYSVKGRMKLFKRYLTRQNVNKVIWYVKRGRIKTLVEKIRKNLTRINDNAQQSFLFDPESFFKKTITYPSINTSRPIDIIIPVYNGFEYLEPLFEGILKHTALDYRLIVVNDASPDDKIHELLKTLMAKHKNTIFIQNEKNLGFVQSVNKAAKECQNHFVLLNTDTEVPEHWLERLMWPIFNKPMVATTTPFTNAGTIASFPKFLEDNALFEGLDVNSTDKAFQWINADKLLLEVPTGVGFCMGINYNLYNKIGFFDEEQFSKGYCEENDWCRRAAAEGYHNVMVPDLFVYHKHGGSFDSEEKKRLVVENYAKLLNKHPDYDEIVHAFIAKDPYIHLRDLLKVMVLSNTTDVVLMFDHSLGGGANTYSKQRVEAYLKEGKKVLRVMYRFYSNDYGLEFDYQDCSVKMTFENHNALFALLNKCLFQEIFINELVSYGDLSVMQHWIAQYKSIYTCKVVLPLHDYFALCPSFTLLNEEGVFCQLPDIDVCQKCLKANDGEIMMFSDERDIKQWRNGWQSLLDVTDSVLAFSLSSKTLFLKVYSGFPAEKVTVKPHSVAPIEPIERSKKSNDDKFTIGVLGAINEAKGILVIKDLLEAIDRQKLAINIKVIGETNMQFSNSHFSVTGRYDHDKLRQIIIDSGIDIFLIPSIWPETFSYTTQEVMMMKMPLMVFDLGAPAERVKDYEYGIVLKNNDVENIIHHVQSFIKTGRWSK